MTLATAWQRLGLGTSCTLAQARLQYLLLQQALDPERHPVGSAGRRETEAELRRVARAYEVLMQHIIDETVVYLRPASSSLRIPGRRTEARLRDAERQAEAERQARLEAEARAREARRALDQVWQEAQARADEARALQEQTAREARAQQAEAEARERERDQALRALARARQETQARADEAKVWQDRAEGEARASRPDTHQPERWLPPTEPEPPRRKQSAKDERRQISRADRKAGPDMVSEKEAKKWSRFIPYSKR
jgi:hypothetical protein